MLTAVVIQPSGAVRVSFVSAGGGEEKLIDPEECLFEPENPVPAGTKIEQSECGPGPSPILPEMKELAWSGGAFLVFAILMRYFLYPRLRKGMDARYNSIREGHENADAARSGARSEVAQYEAAVVAAKVDAAKVIDAARATLETERNAKIAEANARINAKREAAQREAEAAKAAVRGQIESAVADVVTSAVEAATGKRPDSAAVSRAVTDVMSAGAR